MAFHSYSFQGQTVPLLKSDLNILEPKHSPTFHKNLDLLIVPGLAFTRSGYRLGFGKGFFDAYLQHNRPRHVIGVLYPFQLVTTMPLDAHDQIVDSLLIAN
jgi:5-formyltetrahydrofolate cyclo-ligase